VVGAQVTRLPKPGTNEDLRDSSKEPPRASMFLQLGDRIGRAIMSLLREARGWTDKSRIRSFMEKRKGHYFHVECARESEASDRAKIAGRDRTPHTRD
jgi:hypothetical protein